MALVRRRRGGSGPRRRGWGSGGLWSTALCLRRVLYLLTSSAEVSGICLRVVPRIAAGLVAVGGLRAPLLDTSQVVSRHPCRRRRQENPRPDAALGAPESPAAKLLFAAVAPCPPGATSAINKPSRGGTYAGTDARRGPGRGSRASPDIGTRRITMGVPDGHDVRQGRGRVPRRASRAILSWDFFDELILCFVW